jgi:tripartite-type tricarboxylate transporter receptor subunit TctC
MVVVNREGANGAVGVREAINSAPNGYRLALSSYSLFTVTPLLVENADTVALDDLRIITGLAAESVLLLANSDGPYQTLDDLLAAGESGKTISFGHSGPGSGLQFSQLVFFNQAGIEATEVPFDGSSPALTALLGNQVDISASEIAGCVEQVEAGDLVPLGVFTEERSPFVPDVPTMKEQGFDFSIVQGRLMVGPKDLPDDIVNQLVDCFGQAAEDEELNRTLEENYVEKRVNSAEEMRRFLEETRESNARTIEELGNRAQEAS